MNKNIIYLNNAATSWPKPPCVVEAVSRALSEPPGAMHRGGIESFDVFDEVRKKLAALMGLKNHSRIALGPNASWGLNVGIQGFGLKEGDCALTSIAEHNSVLRPLYALRERRGVKLCFAECDESGRIIPESWESLTRKFRPSLSVMTHASNVTGAVSDTKTLAEISHSFGSAVLLDASQSLGFLDVKPEELGADMLAFTGHKYLLGPQGTGGLWIGSGLELSPLLLGGTGIMSELESMPDKMPLRLEAGTGNEPSFFGLLAALNWAEKNPVDIRAVSSLLGYMTEGLSELGCRVMAPFGEKTPVLSFNVPGISPEDAGFMLEESCDIILRQGLHCAPLIFKALGEKQSLRASLSRFTKKSDVDALLKAVSDIRA